MSDAIKALEALRDAAFVQNKSYLCDACEAAIATLRAEQPRYEFKSTEPMFVCGKHQMSGSGWCPECYPSAEQPQHGSECVCRDCSNKRLNLVLARAEKPQACACGGGPGTSDWIHSPHGCHRSVVLAAHQQAAAQPAPPALTAVPEVDIRTPFGAMQASHVSMAYYEDAKLEAERQHAYASRIAQERDAAIQRAEKAEAEYWRMHTAAKQAEYGEQDASNTADDNYRLRVQAERERDEARAELAALKAQEPVANAGARNLRWLINTPAGAWSASGVMLYAAAVASIPLAQHEAAVREARASERKRVAAILKARADQHGGRIAAALNSAADSIRALGEEGGK